MTATSITSWKIAPCTGAIKPSAAAISFREHDAGKSDGDFDPDQIWGGQFYPAA
jgi:hypothetical protein